LKAHLVATDENFRSLVEQHSKLHKQLEEMEAKDHLTLEDEEVEHRLKKQKLRLKDEIINIISRHKQQVA
jgi:uncharacterized protein YdcH (DUF465 family)